MQLPRLPVCEMPSSKEFFPIIESSNFKWNTASKTGWITSTNFVSATGERLTQVFYIRSSETGEKVLWERVSSQSNIWTYKTMSEKPGIDDWIVEIRWTK